MTSKTKQGLNVVIGLGKTGYSCVEYFTARKLPVAVIDTRNNPPGKELLAENFPEVATHFGGVACDLLEQAEQVILSPGVSIYLPELCKLRANGIPIVGDIELFAKEVRSVPIIAITGSNAKTTVTQLVGEMAKHAGVNAHVGGNIGIPALSMLKLAQPEYYVLELSSFQLETIESLKPKLATVLNVSHDHLDRHGNFDEYLQLKQKVYQNSEITLFNRGDKNTFPPEHHGTKRMSFGLDKPKTSKNDEVHYGVIKTNGETWMARNSEPLIPVNDLYRREQHNVQNALAALAIGDVMGLPVESMRETLTKFTGLMHRCQVIGQHNQVDWINDSKGTNVGATIQAIQSYAQNTNASKLRLKSDEKIILIAGGEGKDTNFSSLASVVKKSVKAVILLGRDRVLIGKALAGAAPLFFVDDLHQAVKLAEKVAKAGDTVLLSPACSSFDMFDNYAQRGEIYTDIVKKEVLSSAAEERDLLLEEWVA